MDFSKLKPQTKFAVVSFLIPNFPSWLLPYLEYREPVICATDVNTDIKEVVVDNGFGLWCESKDTLF